MDKQLKYNKKTCVNALHHALEYIRLFGKKLKNKKLEFPKEAFEMSNALHVHDCEVTG